ncbi:MMPL family transporter [Solicola gregarius]|uniref:MMPL family transporter n=1 Tax=Solicola gregarius TaxID=2908642 RepID=A0AA46YKK8_9ACTN|nr:MMPL family transporter [Solicola gregarius]UYM04063.1 MMPL family transporter [Solicola gregarius]
MLGRLSDLMLQRRRRVLVIALIVALAAGASSATLFDKLKGGGFDDPGADSATAADILREDFGQGPSNLVLLVDSPDSVDDDTTATEASELVEQLTAEPYVEGVTSYWTAGQPDQLRSTDGDQALVLATVTGDDTEVDKRIGDLAPRYEGEHGSLDIEVGGYAMLQHEMSEQSTHDATIGEAIAFPIALVALLLVFGSVVAATLPLIVAFATLMLTLGVMWVLASVADVSVIAVNVVTLLGLGLAIDYSLLIVSRFREEIDGGREIPDALRNTVRSAGKTVAFSSVTVAIALSTLLWFPPVALRSMAYAGIAVALLSALTSLTILPALLAVAGPRVAKRRFGRSRTERSVEDGAWHRLASFVMRRPIPIATVVVVALLALGAPFLGLKLSSADERTMPESASSRQVADTIRTDFESGEQNALSVVVPGAGDDLDGYAAALSQLDDVARVDGAGGAYVDGAVAAEPGPGSERFRSGDAAYLSVVPSTGNQDALDDLVVDVRDVPAPSTAYVGGAAAVNHDVTVSLVDRLPVAGAALAISVVVLLFLLTGSALLPFIAMALSMLSLTATFGALVWIFQDGHLSGLLGGFTVTGALVATVPVMLFAVAFGLAMDYQVFLLSRIKEEYDRSGDSIGAVALGLEKVGRIVTAAAVLISLVFLGFLVSDITFMKAFGIGLPLAVLIDATLIRGALLPATMRLTGRATWWAPKPLRRFHERFGIHEGDSVEEPAPDPVRV